MADESWGDDFQAPAPRRAPGVPRWVWGCGCGCLALALALVIGLVVAGDRLVAWFESHGDPEVQWPRVAEVLPVEEPPEDLAIMQIPFIGMMGIDTWYLADYEQGLHAILMSATGETGDELARTMLDPDHGRSALDEDIEAGEREEVRIQGRAIGVLRFEPRRRRSGDDEEEGERPRVGVDQPWGHDANGAGAILDLSPADGSRTIVFQIMRERSLDPLTDDELRGFLAPFTIGPDPDAIEAPPPAEGEPAPAEVPNEDGAAAVDTLDEGDEGR